MKDALIWLDWARELQSLAQAGLAYSKDVYDLERFTRIREISAEIMSHQTDLPMEKVRDLFCNETGYQTPKIDTRAAVIQGDTILLVQERDGLWALPGGWCDADQTIGNNTVKETREEAGLEVRPVRLIALHGAHRNHAVCPYGICKAFVLCEALGGSFAPNTETIASGYFSLEELPPLAMQKNTPEQIALCFEAAQAPGWETQFD